MQKLLISFFLVTNFLFCSLIVFSQKPNKKPNVIFILADDLGIGNVSAYGSDNYKTPNIDKLAKEGILYNHTYTAPLCGPSRALILTGRYAFRTGATNQDATGQMTPEKEIMMPGILKSAGYVSTCVGKWGQLPLGPAEFGFDDYLRFFQSGVYVNKENKKVKYVENGEQKIMKDDEYMPDLMHNHLMKFISENRKKNFYAYYSMSHVHADIVPTPDSKPDTKDSFALFADNIQYMDKLVGKLIEGLDSLGLRQNTLIVFMGDNGTSKPWFINSTIQGKQLSGKKGEMKECGSLVPMIINWPGVVKPGTISDRLIDASDFVPTFADLCSAKLPKGLIIDGKSFAGQIKGENAKERDWIFVELGNKWYVRNHSWKLTQSDELFDMSNAPYAEKKVEDHDKSLETAKAFEELHAVLETLRPQDGILDSGDGSGRHANKSKKSDTGTKTD